MKPMTIDQLDLKIHERYAQDQQRLDTKYIKADGGYAEIASTSTLFPSQFELLFQLQSKNLPWACFSPPLTYQMQSNQFFSYRLLPTIFIDDSSEEDSDDSENEKDSKKLIQMIQNVKKGKKQNPTQFENERTLIVSLLESISHLDKILSQINSRKRQYQKG